MKILSILYYSRTNKVASDKVCARIMDHIIELLIGTLKLMSNCHPYIKIKDDDLRILFRNYNNIIHVLPTCHNKCRNCMGYNNIMQNAMMSNDLYDYKFDTWNKKKIDEFLNIAKQKNTMIIALIGEILHSQPRLKSDYANYKLYRILKRPITIYTPLYISHEYLLDKFKELSKNYISLLYFCDCINKLYENKHSIYDKNVFRIIAKLLLN